MTLEEYILAHSDQEPPLLAKLNRDVNLRLLYPRMCSGHLQGRILTMLTAMIAPRAALELGTYAGYSALCMAEGLPQGGHLDTVEIDDEMEEFIRARLAESPYGDRVSLHIGDCAEVLPSLGRQYDMVYMDANKRTYCETYRMVLPMVRPGGFILADNTLWDGKVTAPEANHDPQTLGICRFNDMVAADPRVSRVILPLRDGLTLIRVNPSPATPTTPTTPICKERLNHES
jgi:predicted O-methyltransferase YrrM